MAGHFSPAFLLEYHHILQLKTQRLTGRILPRFYRIVVQSIRDGDVLTDTSEEKRMLCLLNWNGKRRQ